MLETLRRALRRRPKFPKADVYVISYPKSGRTWLRLMLGRILEAHFGLALAKPGDVMNVHKFAKQDGRIPKIRFYHDGPPSLDREEDLDRDKSRFSGASVVFLVRDPRDVMMSSWFRKEKHEKYGDDTVFRGSLSEYVRHPVHGVGKIAAFMNVWAANRQVPRRFLLVRYEDLKQDAAKELRGLLEFLGIEGVSDAAIEGAVSYGSLDNMRKMEEEDTLASGRLRPTSDGAPKVRRGVAGGYRDDLAPDDLRYVDEVVATKLDPFFRY